MGWLGSLGISMFAFVSAFGLTLNFTPGQRLLPWFYRRIIRIYPPLWLFYVISVGMTVLALHQPPKSIWVLNFLGLNALLLWSGEVMWQHNTWWIGFILASYVLFPLIVEAMSSQKRIALLAVVLFVSIVLSQFAAAGNTNLWLCFPAFLIGVEVALFHRDWMGSVGTAPWLVTGIAGLSYESYLYPPLFMGE